MELLILASMVVFAAGSIEKKDMPELLCNCYSNSNYNATTDNARPIHYKCIEYYLTRTYQDRWYVNQTESGKNFLKSLDREMVVHLTTHRRHKRQASHPIQGTRMEIRTAPTDILKIFFDTINELKRDTTAWPNVYESLANYHSGQALGAAHIGPAFLPWHRFYLIKFQMACQRKNPRFVMLYWDSALDDHGDGDNTHGRDAIIWDNDYLGSSTQGVVRDGQFRNWRYNGDTPITRTYTGEVISKSEIEDVLNSKTNSEVMDKMETSHNIVHASMGGTMFDTTTAPHDPVFWLHHCFIDCWWEWFRERQIQDMGAAYEYDYPQTNDPLHQPYALLGGGIEPLSNLNGLQSVLTAVFFKCDKRLTCPGTCENQENFYCDRRNVCLPRRRRRNNRNPESVRGGENTGGWNTRRKRDVHLNDADGEDENTEPKSIINECYQNSYTLDGKADINRWAFTAVRILYKRSKGTVFNCNPIHNGHIEMNHDIYSSDNETQTTNHRKKVDSGSGATKVMVQSDGFSYNGKYLDYGIVDARQKMSETIAYVGMKHPRLGVSKAYISAFDLHGIVCKPYCLDKSSTPVKYKECSGVIELTTEAPKMYGDTIAEAVMYRYTYGGDTVYPESQYRDIYLTFVCEHSNESPWSYCQN